MLCNFKEYSPGVYIYHKNLENREKTLTDFSGAIKKTDKLNEFKHLSCDILENIDVYTVDNKTVVLVPLEEDAVLYGGGLNYKSTSCNLKALHLKMDHHSGVDNGRTHAPTPFYISNKGYGVFLNTTHYVDLYLGTANRLNSKKGYKGKDRNTDPDWDASPKGEYVEMCVNNAKSLEIVVFLGDNILEIVQKYNLFCGGGFIPPKWGLGIWKRTPLPFSDEQVIDNANEFSKKDFPLDVIGLEPGWHSQSYPCTYEWDEKRFKSPKEFCKKLLDKNIRINLWENAYISPNSKIYSPMLPYAGSHTVWEGIVPDYTIDKACNILKKQHKENHLDIGVSGYKLDECDGFDSWLWPDHAVFPSNNSAETLRSIYGILLQKTTYEIYKENNIRTYGLTRATNGGCSFLPYVLYNDCYDFEDFLIGLCNVGFIGAMWVPEVRSADNAKEWLCRNQLVCFSPMAMLNSWASELEPWSFLNVSNEIRDLYKLRKQFLPYLYSAFAKYEEYGIPPFRALVMDDAPLEYVKEQCGELHDTKNPYKTKQISTITDQYYMGDSIMVAPFKPNEDKRDVILPVGNWYDFYSGKYVGNNETITIDFSANAPLFVKDGGLIPLLDDNGIVTVKYYGTKESEFILYDDDGTTFDYLNGLYDTVHLSVKNVDNTTSFETNIIHNGLKDKNYTAYNFVIMS